MFLEREVKILFSEFKLKKVGKYRDRKRQIPKESYYNYINFRANKG